MKIKGTRNEYARVETDDYISGKGKHEAIISEELWNQAQVRMKERSKKSTNLHIVVSICYQDYYVVQCVVARCHRQLIDVQPMMESHLYQHIIGAKMLGMKPDTHALTNQDLI